jgi:hypothetical protein
VPRPDDHDTVAVQPVFDELARITFGQQSLESVLSTITELATQVLPGEPVTSVTIIRSKNPTTVASSSALALELDRVQYGLGSGPCLSAASTGVVSELLDTRNAAEWPEFASTAAERGVGSVLSFPLPVQERLSGALTRELVSRFAAYAVVPVSNMYLYEAAVERAGHLQIALDSRAVIDQAKGILMERFKLTADSAFQVLARVSMETNTKVRDVAQALVETGELPAG